MMKVSTACMVFRLWAFTVHTNVSRNDCVVCIVDLLLLLYALPAAFRKRGRDNEISLREPALFFY